LRQDTSERGSVKWKRHLAAMDAKFLEKILNGKF